jgi:hypothetical protein
MPWLETYPEHSCSGTSPGKRLAWPAGVNRHLKNEAALDGAASLQLAEKVRVSFPVF